ncbi:unnamed protein product, partial [Ectocarpus sp. 12 AP-2014]
LHTRFLLSPQPLTLNQCNSLFEPRRQRNGGNKTLRVYTPASKVAVTGRTHRTRQPQGKHTLQYRPLCSRRLRQCLTVKSVSGFCTFASDREQRPAESWEELRTNEL